MLTSQPQPEPWMPAVALLNAVVKASRVPHSLRMDSLRGPSGSTPPVPLPSVADGARFFQKREWLMCPAGGIQTHLTDNVTNHIPPPLNLMAAWREMRSFAVEAFAYAPSAAFSALTYVWWCFVWCRVIIWEEMAGSRAWWLLVGEWVMTGFRVRRRHGPVKSDMIPDVVG